MEQILQNYNTIACFDSTHNTCFSRAGHKKENNKKAFLYIIVVKNKETGRSAPSVFMITGSKAQYAIADFLRWLCKTGLFQCKNWMIDFLPTEVAGIQKGQGLDVVIFICLFHVFDAMIKQTSKKLKVCTLPSLSHAPLSHPLSQSTGGACSNKVAANCALRKVAIADFKEIAYAKTQQEFQRLWDDHVDQYNNQHNWIKYLLTQ